MSIEPNTPASLESFMRAKERATCAVCQLPPDVQAQLGKAAGKKGFTREDQLEWLQKAVGATSITLEVLIHHLNANHRPENGT